LPTTASDFGIDGLEPETEYTVRVRAVISGTDSTKDPGHYLAYANTALYTFTTEPRPGAPEIIAQTPYDGQAVISFLRADAEMYDVAGYEYRLDDGSWVTLTGLPDGDPTVFTIPNLTNGRTYDVTVRAITRDGIKLPSNTVSVTPTGPIAIPGNKEAWVLVPEDDDAIGYQVQFVNPDGTFGPWTAVPGNAGSVPVNLRDLENGTEYCLRLRPVYSTGPGAASSTTCVTPSGAEIADLRFGAAPNRIQDDGRPVIFNPNAGEETVSRPFTVGNVGENYIIDVWLRFDNLPSVFEVVSIVPNENRGIITRYGPNSWYWQGVTLPSGGEASMTITFRLKEDAQ
jgi:hypothetical protein